MFLNSFKCLQWEDCHHVGYSRGLGKAQELWVILKMLRVWKVKQKLFTIIWHCWSQLKNVDLSRIWTCTFGILVCHSTCWSYQVHRDWRQVFIQFKCIRYSHNNFTLIHERMCNVSIPFDFGSIRLSWKVSVHVCLWRWFWNEKLIWSTN